MSANHEEHGHDHVPAVATEIVDEKSPEDMLLVALATFCLLALMICFGDWMTGVAVPSGGGHGHEAVHPGTGHETGSEASH
ncbi:MAG: hypothetical protein IPM23_13535 [Candidatus Melainabacteria bacterium]|nr:hypothetical protein [Candidatus Melainabacteria bacterium]